MASVRIIARKVLVAFALRHPEVTASLTHWERVTKAAAWKNPAEVIDAFPKAKAINGERVRFEVSGGNYRLIVAFDFGRSAAFIKFIGSHAEYDRVDAATVSQF
jgi:mRNA interferase HigB